MPQTKQPPSPSDAISRQSIPDQVSDKILKKLDAGYYVPGQLLAEGELAKDFSVGRSSVRTALQNLQRAGVASVERGKGWRLHERPADVGTELMDWTHGDYQHLSTKVLEVRLALEKFGIGLAAVNAAPDEIEQMQDLCDAYAKADVSNIDELMAADEAFHTALMAGGQNPILDSLYETLQRDIRNFRARSYDSHGSVHRRATDQHQQMVEAIRDREPVLAQEYMRIHIETLMDEVRADRGA